MASNQFDMSTSWKLLLEDISVEVTPVRSENGVVGLPIRTDVPENVTAYFISVQEGLTKVGLYIWGKAEDLPVIKHMGNILFTNMASGISNRLEMGIGAFASEAERLKLGWWPENSRSAEALLRKPLWEVVDMPQAAKPSMRTFNRDYAGWPDAIGYREKAGALISQAAVQLSP